MTLKHISYSDSIVMKELEKVAKKSNLVKDEPIVKKASIKLGSSEDLFLDIITLSSALREKGFIKQAEKLEEKAMFYKQAEKDVQENKYEWWEETGNCLVDYSHLCDDFEEIPSSKGYGYVENVNEIHKLLEQSLARQPKGKQGSEDNKSIIVKAINALAQEVSYKPKEVHEGTLGAEINKKKANPSKLIVSKENLDEVSKIASATKNDDLSNLINKINSYKDLLNQINKNNSFYHGVVRAVKPETKITGNLATLPETDATIANYYNKVVSDINNAIALWNKDEDRKGIDGLYNDFMKATDDIVKNINKSIDVQIGNANNYIKSACDYINKELEEEAGSAVDDSNLYNVRKNLEYVAVVNKNLSKINRDPFKRYLLSSIDPVKYSPVFTEISNNAIDILQNINKNQKAIGKPEIPQVNDAIKRLSSGFDKMPVQDVLNYFSNLNAQITEYIEDTNKKKELKVDGIKLVAFDTAKIIKESWTTDGTSAKTPAPAGGGGKAYTKKEPAVSNILSAEARSSISSMQQLLTELGSKSSSRSDTKSFAALLNKATADNGNWGINTEKALDAAKKMASLTGFAGEIDLIDPRKPLMNEKEENVIERADNNAKAIMQIMVTVFKEDRYAEAAYSKSYLDIIPRDMKEFDKDEKLGVIKLKQDNLKSLYSLKRTLMNNSFVPGEVA